jgi:hypothetical protein
MKNKFTIFLIAIIFAVSLASDSFAQSQKYPFEIIIDRDGFSSFDGKNYISITIFLNNNTNEILYYQGSDCYNVLFALKHNPYFHLTTDMCKNMVYSKKVLPPHRSQKMQIFLTMDKQPDKDVSLSVNMKLYKWAGNKINANEDELSGKLSDTTILHYNSNHQSFWPRGEFAILDKKEERILPNKDIYLLTDADRKLYKLTVDEKQITKGRDTIVKVFNNNTSKKATVVSIPISLNNDSNDTLRFYSMTCSWFEFWETNRRDIGISGWACDNNIREIVNIPPHQEYKKRLDIIYDSTVKRGNQYQISMSLLKSSNDVKWIWNFWPDEYVRFNKIWSNELTIH